ncbi:hypothetical protein [Amycolatopsis aidingensis]|uniref:hypothetical protein n=1 Tax=Amycolatopsis aidingensis TaxID=2842453 RepID=UPI001E599F2C|nr:hypothetical protein [Amycolatopsis aidingensis]
MIDDTVGAVRVRIHVGEDGAEFAMQWRQAGTELLFVTQSWRTFRWYDQTDQSNGQPRVL